MTQLFDDGLRALEANDPHEALRCFDRALQEKPRDAASHYHRAKAFYLLKDRPRAVTALDAAIVIDSKQLAWRAERAQLLFEQRCWMRSIEDLDIVLTAEPQRGDLLTLRGRCHAALGDSIAALADFDAAIALG